MVSTFATGYATDAKGRRFKRRNFLPALVILAVLVLVAVIAWSVTLSGGEEQARPVDCNPPTSAGAPSFQQVSRADLQTVPPAALSQFQVSVLNASPARGQARSVSDDLAEQGFVPGDPAHGNDTVYPDQDLDCVAQIRFGQAGQGAAAAVWLAVPCAELVNDGRVGSDVDLVLGRHFDQLPTSQDVQAALEALRAVDPRNPKSTVDPSLLDAVHQQSC